MKALGFIETYGLLPAIEAADAMLKAAEVRLLDKSLATGGLVTITVTGDVAAVRASVDAGVASVGRIQGARVVSQHVIARPDKEIDKIINKLPGQTLCECGSAGLAAGEDSCVKGSAGVPAEETVTQETDKTPAGKTTHKKKNK